MIVPSYDFRFVVRYSDGVEERVLQVRWQELDVEHGYLWTEWADVRIEEE